MADFITIFHPEVLLPWIISMIFGIFVGGIPGLTATMAVALIVPISYYLPPTAGLAMIIGVSFTAIFAGDIPATFLRIPGTPASGAAILDGYEMSKKGEGSLALSLMLVCSSLGGIIGIVLLIFVASILVDFALMFTHYEYFWLAVFGLSMSAVITEGSRLKGLFSVLVGLMLSTVGMDVTSGFARFTFGITELAGGVDFIPVMIGLFGLSEVFKYVSQPRSLSVSSLEEEVKFSFRDIFGNIWKYKTTFFSSAIIGTLVGALPGAGADLGAWVAYGSSKSRSSDKEKWGTGCIEGVIAPTSANNAGLGGAWIPALVFGLPGDTITAIVIGAMMMYGLTPGPLVFERNPDLINNIYQIALVSQIFLLIFGVLGIRFYSYVLKLKRSVIMAIVIIFSLIGAFALNNSFLEMGVVLILGFVGFLFEKADIPLVPLILALILGPMIEDSLRVGILSAGGGIMPFFTRPISIILMLLLIASLFGPIIKEKIMVPLKKVG